MDVIQIKEIEDIKGKGTFFLNIGCEMTGSEPSFEYVKRGVELALKKRIHALVTAPISKKKWLDAGIPFGGHTEFLATVSEAENHVMFFWSEKLKVALFTTHIPLKDIFSCITKRNIIQFIRFVHSELKKLFLDEFTFLISGLNPHSGENGFIGHEEVNEIIPAIKILKSEMDISGPFPPDTIFSKAIEKKNSVVISWYHDQGLIPFKLLNHFSGVNLTLGLPFIRTAPDHGTACDIAGKGIADPTSMKHAIKLADFLLHRPR